MSYAMSIYTTWLGEYSKASRSWCFQGPRRDRFLETFFLSLFNSFRLAHNFVDF